MREIFLDFRRSLLRGKNAVAKGSFKSYAERVTFLKRRQQQERLAIDSPVINGVFVAMDSQMNGGTTHLREAGSFDIPALGDRVAHNIAGSSLSMHREDKFVHGIVEVKQLQEWLQK